MLMAKVFVVLVRWTQAEMIAPERVDFALTSVGRWLRYNSDTWLVGSEMHAQQIFERLQYSIGPNSVVVMQVHGFGEIAGTAPKEVWEWLAAQRTTLAEVLSGSGKVMPPFQGGGAPPPMSPFVQPKDKK